MDRTTIAAIFADQEALGGQTVTVCGWAKTVRLGPPHPRHEDLWLYRAQ